MLTRKQWLLLVTCVLSIYGVGQVWLVQLSSYRLWAYVGQHEFRSYHVTWWHSIWGVVLAPAILVFVGAALMLRWRVSGVPSWSAWLGFGLQIALVLGTALWWGPLMARLEAPDGGLLPERYQVLMTTHWLRVGIITAYGLLVCWMLARSAWRANPAA
jgi:hypothetical protein